MTPIDFDGIRSKVKVTVTLNTNVLKLGRAVWHDQLMTPFDFEIIMSKANVTVNTRQNYCHRGTTDGIQLTTVWYNSNFVK